MIFSTPPISELVSTLEDPKSPIGKRMRAAYYCKQILSDSNDNKQNDNDNNDATDDATNDNNDNVNLLMDILCKQLLNIHHGSLLRHEFAYILGQLQNPKSIPVLEYVVSNSNECVMVRHEAAEALGAIASPSSIELLTNYSSDDDSPKELADTCLLSIKRIQQQEQQNQSSKEEEIVACPCSTTPFSATIDPALISTTTTTTTNENEESIEQLYMILSNPTIDIVERYRAMFTLRNRGAVESICQVLKEDKSSSLLRHELAFVLGQLQSPKSINCLLEILGRPNEHIMVRHEAAEALGAIEGCSSEEWELIEKTLHSYQKDPIQAISESCIVALDAADYWGSSNSSSQQQQSSHNDDDEKKDHDDDGEEEEKDDGILLFRQQKNQTAGIPSSNNNNNNNIRREILNQHFNVATN